MGKIFSILALLGISLTYAAIPLTEVVSFTHTYAGEVIDGEHVVAKGKVEKVIVNGEFSHYRIVVGTTREAIDEYLKLKESPA